MRPARFSLGLSAVLLLAASACAAPDSSPRPTPRGSDVSRAVAPTAEDRALAGWVAGFRPRALAAGISDATFAAAMTGLRYDPEVVERDRNQAEFTKTIWEYLEIAASDERVANGRRAVRDQNATLAAIESRYRVEGEVVAAIWGLESAYGTRRGDTRVLDALATLAYDGRRGRFFEQQLIAALKIIQSGDTSPDRLRGSWAGAMGHTQFIPTSYLAYAQDFDGDGRRDIWAEDPVDALASTANYLRQAGWVYGQPWGMEVRLPEGYDYRQSGKAVKKPVGEWLRLGVRDVAGNTIPDYGTAQILLPAGSRGAAFMVFKNFQVISRYNAADAYVIGVGHLSDRIKGGDRIAAAWPTGDRALKRAERRELQERLSAKGYATGGADGVIGPNTEEAIRRYQRAVGLTPDGHASWEMLRRLR